METWLTSKFESKFLTDYDIYESLAKQTATKGRAKGGILLGIKKAAMQFVISVQVNHDIVKVRTHFLAKTIDIIFCYASTLTQQTLNSLLPRPDATCFTKDCTLMGDFNARIGMQGDRKSKDLITNKKGQLMMDFINNNDLTIQNGNSQSDVDGELTFINRNGSSVIDLCLVSDSISNIITDFSVLTSSQSCHMPICLYLPSNKIKTMNVTVKVNRIKWEECKLGQFTCLMNEETNYKIYNEIQNGIIAAAKTCDIWKPRYLEENNVNFHPRFFNDECRTQKKNTLKALRMLRKSKLKNLVYSDALAVYVEERSKYRNLIKKSKYEFYEKI